MIIIFFIDSHCGNSIMLSWKKHKIDEKPSEKVVFTDDVKSN